MRKLIGLTIVLCCFLSTAFADIIPPPTLNQITMQLSAEDWVTTQTAQITVTVDASLDKNRLATIHQDILKNLNKISNKSQWQITAFNRTPAQSGLENLHVAAQIRLPESDLANLRDQAKAVSKPGENYTISNIEFTPTLAEMEAGRALLRARIYNQAKAELAEINKIYPNANFYLHNINFQAQPMPIEPMIRAEGMGVGALSVSNKLTLSALVSFAANSAKNT